MATTLVKSLRAANCLHKVARNVTPRLCTAALVHNTHENRQLHFGPLSTKLLAVRAGSVLEVSCRLFSAKRKDISKEDITERVLKVCRDFDKVVAEKLTVNSHFMNDLGLDSLDQVEVIMAMEDEFGFEIPDVDAERLMTPQDIVQYICDKEDTFDE